MGRAAATPLRRTDRAVARSACALLTPRLGTAASNLGSALGAVRPSTPSRQLGVHDLVHDTDIGFDVEDCGVESNLSDLFTLLRQQPHRAHRLSPNLSVLARGRLDRVAHHNCGTFGAWHRSPH